MKSIKETTEAHESKGRLEFADGLRDLAALWVVLFHLWRGGHVKALADVLPDWLIHIVFDSGELGVTVFFVLSGFVMMLTLNKLLVSRQVAVRFVARRLARLIPPYYVAIGVALVFLWMKSRALHLPFVWPDFELLMAHASFTQDIAGMTQLNIVFWTLCVEVQFTSHLPLWCG
jgi:peptidoglycan/LPS O-acetylase OafA/YrhL